MKKFELNYEGDEYDFRFNIFKSNLATIQQHNENTEKTFTMGLNQFSALTSEEFSAKFNGYENVQKPKSFTILDTTNLPSSVNWTAAGAVTSIKNQGECGSCWSFSTCGSMEGLNAILNNQLISLSEQQIMDCSYEYGNFGCDGGDMTRALEYTAAKGLESLSDYPYTAKNSIFCKYNKSEVVFQNTGHTNVPPKNVTQLMAAVVQQPISVAVQADQAAWQHYQSGIVTSNCGQMLDHGVLVVGYGTSEEGVDFWNVKNSWGQTWGMEGYILIERGDSDLCGILDQPTYPTVSSL